MNLKQEFFEKIHRLAKTTQWANVDTSTIEIESKLGRSINVAQFNVFSTSFQREF